MLSALHIQIVPGATLALLSQNTDTMSLRVPKANNIQLFKDGYKVCCMLYVETVC